MLTIWNWARIGAAIPHLVHRTLDAEAGTLVLVAQAATFQVGRAILADPATLTLTGTAAALQVGRALIAEPGGLYLIVSDATFPKTGRMDLDPATLRITVNDAALIYGKKLSMLADEGLLILIGYDVKLTYGQAIGADPADLTLTGEEVALQWGRAILVEPASLQLDGLDVDLLWNKQLELTAEGNGLVIEGQDAVLRRFRSQEGWDGLLHPAVDGKGHRLSDAVHPRGERATPFVGTSE